MARSIKPVAPDEIRCPTCRGINWLRDGFTMTQTVDGEVVRQRIGPLAATSSNWSCRSCTAEISEVSELGLRLTEARLIHED